MSLQWAPRFFELLTHLKSRLCLLHVNSCWLIAHQILKIFYCFNFLWFVIICFFSAKCGCYLWFSCMPADILLLRAIHFLNLICQNNFHPLDLTTALALWSILTGSFLEKVHKLGFLFFFILGISREALNYHFIWKYLWNYS